MFRTDPWSDLPLSPAAPRRVAALLASLPTVPKPRPPGVDAIDEVIGGEPDKDKGGAGVPASLPEEPPGEAQEEPPGYGPDPDYCPPQVEPEETPPLPER